MPLKIVRNDITKLKVDAIVNSANHTLPEQKPNGTDGAIHEAAGVEELLVARKEICKDVKKLCEDAKVAIRNIRSDMTDELKKIEKSENLSEDTVKDNQDKIQKQTDKYIKIAEDLSAEKEKEVLTV